MNQNIIKKIAIALCITTLTASIPVHASFSWSLSFKDILVSAVRHPQQAARSIWGWFWGSSTSVRENQIEEQLQQDNETLEKNSNDNDFFEGSSQFIRQERKRIDKAEKSGDCSNLWEDSTHNEDEDNNSRTSSTSNSSQQKNPITTTVEENNGDSHLNPTEKGQEKGKEKVSENEENKQAKRETSQKQQSPRKKLTKDKEEKQNLIKQAFRPQEREMFQKLIQNIIRTQKKNINVQDKLTGRNLLHQACINNNFKAAQMLVKAGIQVDAKNLMGETPLYIAAANNNVQIVNLLCKKDETRKPFGEFLSTLETRGKSIKEYARVLGLLYPEEWRQQRENYTRTWGRTIASLVLSPQPKKTILSNKLPKNTFAEEESLHEDDFLLIDNDPEEAEIYTINTPLGGQLRITKNSNHTCTIEHIQNKNGVVTVTPIEAGAESINDASSNNLEYYLWLAIKTKRLNSAESMLKCGANPNVKYKDKPLIFIAMENSRSLQLLAKYQVDTNITFKGFTPLTFAAGQGDLTLCQILFEYGADINQVDEYGSTAYQTALTTPVWNAHLLQFLKKNGANTRLSSHSWSNSTDHTMENLANADPNNSARFNERMQFIDKKTKVLEDFLKYRILFSITIKNEKEKEEHDKQTMRRVQRSPLNAIPVTQRAIEIANGGIYNRKKLKPQPQLIGYLARKQLEQQSQSRNHK